MSLNEKKKKKKKKEKENKTEKYLNNRPFSIRFAMSFKHFCYFFLVFFNLLLEILINFSVDFIIFITSHLYFFPCLCILLSISRVLHALLIIIIAPYILSLLSCFSHQH